MVEKRCMSTMSQGTPWTNKYITNVPMWLNLIFVTKIFQRIKLTLMGNLLHLNINCQSLTRLGWKCSLQLTTSKSAEDNLCKRHPHIVHILHKPTSKVCIRDNLHFSLHAHYSLITIDTFIICLQELAFPWYQSTVNSHTFIMILSYQLRILCDAYILMVYF